MMTSTVPNIPGEPVRDTTELKNKVAKLLNLNSYRFPGAQPISFGASQLLEIQREDFYVAEKSDGVRCLALLTTNERREPEVYLFDRKNRFHVIRKFLFPVANDPSYRHCWNNTIIDGEFVLDKEADGSTQLKFLLFDCLCIDGKVLVSRDLMKRLGHLRSNVIKPHHDMLKEYPDMVKKLPFRVEFKEQQYAYHLKTIFNEIIPNLKHGNDGLIFTSVNAPYAMGTCNKMLKWKPLNENSVDFKVKLHFPGCTIPGVHDYTAVPRVDLLVWQGGDSYVFFSRLGITDREWKEKFSDRPNYMDGKIIECNYDPELESKLDLQSPWRFMRYRDDKQDGNHQSTVDNVLRSINDAVTKEQLIECMPRIKEGWDSRRRNDEKRAEDDRGDDAQKVYKKSKLV
ncbi:mRNA capping enzyme, catalytic domain-containing protein [Pilobolus umbonatus]|nr:mRNA capping enzyme, catalytic domain-containing protein [Pilobolus umbonatus]